MTIAISENRKITVDTALISGVMPRRRRPQISSGSVLSRPIRKKLTAISSIESVKIKSAAPMIGSLWRPLTVVLCALYSLLFADRTPGMWVAGIYSVKPFCLPYVLLYTAGFATILYYVWVPFDLLMPQNTIETALKILVKQGRLRQGSTVVIIGLIMAVEEIVDAVQMRVV